MYIDKDVCECVSLKPMWKCARANSQKSWKCATFEIWHQVQLEVNADLNPKPETLNLQP